jgi:hypothetical protein
MRKLYAILLAVIVLAVAALLGKAATAHATDEFIVQCAYSHSAMDDPIVYPGQPGASHLHNFFGNTGTDAFSTLTSLMSGPSTCGTPSGVDNAAYWQPAMWIGTKQAIPRYTRIYYKRDAPSGVKVVPFPPGAEMIGGDKMRMTPSPGIVSFSCGQHTLGDTPSAGNGPYDCKPYIGGDSSRDGLVARVIFPHCWDGVGNQPGDFTGYGSTCPAGTKYVPRLRFGIHYFACGANNHIYNPMTDGPTPGPGVVTFGSYPGQMPWTANHADFFNAWDQTALTTEINKAINTQPNSLGTFFGKLVGDPGVPTC